MSEDQNIQQDETTDNSQHSTEENSQSQISNQKPETVNMEAHHPQHITHKKKWTEYVLEFFMLFLAVFLGFIAENIREHAVEKERAKQYIHSFYNDLLNDTAQFSLLISEYESTVKGLAGRKDCFQSIEQQANSEECLQQLFNISSGFTDLIPNDQTLQQLKNSGNFRLLPSEDADSMLLYDKWIRSYVKQETTGLQESQYTLRNTIYSLLNYKRTIIQSGETKETILFSENKELLNKYFNLLDDYFWRRQLFLRNLIQLDRRAKILIEYFKTSYHLR